MRDNIEKCVHSLSNFPPSKRLENVSESYFVAHVYPQDSLCADRAMHWVAQHSGSCGAFSWAVGNMFWILSPCLVL